MRASLRGSNTAVSLLCLALAGCAADTSSDGGASCDDGQCDQNEKPLKTPCDSVLADRSGRGFLPEGLADDPLIKHVYASKDGGCPVTAEEILAKLKLTDKADCSFGGGGLATRVISEQAQLAGASSGSGYRAVTTKRCGKRKEFELLISMFGFSDSDDGASFGLQPTGTKLPPEGVEIIAFDPSAGVFNYYKEVDGKIAFFGNSLDFVTQKPGGPNITDTRGCSNCHTGGGLIMKELSFPWLHWQGATTTPGADDLVTSRKALLGKVEDGINLEKVISDGNDRWNLTRIEHFKQNGTVEDLLRPLFCSVEVNLESAAPIDSDPEPTIDGSMFLDILLPGFVSFTAEPAQYNRVLAAIGAEVPGSGKPDTFFPFAHSVRSRADHSYVEKLIKAKVIDDQFRNDVLMVNFTRPTFSPDRCELLAKAPTLDGKNRTLVQIRDGFITNLKGSKAGTPAAQLLAHLEASAAKTPIDHASTLTAYDEACKVRKELAQITLPGSGAGKANPLLVDVFKLRSLNRQLSFIDGVLDEQGFRVYEFDDTMTADQIEVTTSAKPDDVLKVHPAARLSPVNCTLVSTFVPVEVKPAAE